MQTDNAHPNVQELLRFSRLSLDARAEMADVAGHVDACAECGSRVEAMAGWDEELRATNAQPLPEPAEYMAEGVFNAGLAAAYVRPLILMSMPTGPEPARLAADGEEQGDDLTHVATFYSESPDVVLRIMRDNVSGDVQIHVITSPPDLAAFAMIKPARVPTSIFTDSRGLGTMDGDGSAELIKDGFSLHMPIASFELESDKIQPDGQVALELTDSMLQHSGLQRATYTVVQRNELIGTGEIQSGQALSIVLSDPVTPVTVRLYVAPNE